MENKKVPQESTQQSAMGKFFNLNYSEYNDAIWLGETQDALRNTVGILGICLPVFLYLGLWIDTGHNIPLESISHYYFTRVGSVLIIIVSLLAFFLIIYKGNSESDFWISLGAGLCALALLLFPTSNIVEASECAVGHHFAENGLKQTSFRVKFHLYSAGVFLLLLAVMSVWLFPKPIDQNRLVHKKIRNLIYRICGWLMFVFIAVIVISMATHFDETDFYKNNKITFWMESLAVWCFGISWMVKGTVVRFITG